MMILNQSLPEPFERVEVIAGQIWRAHNGNTASLVFIDEVHDADVRIALVEIGRDFADDTTAVLPPETSWLRVALTVWCDFAKTAPASILDYLIGDTGHKSISDLRAAVDAWELNTGLPILNLSGRRALARTEIQDELTALAGRSDGVPEVIGAVSADHDCLRDRVPGAQHCITCHQQGHTYVAHLGALGIEPRILGDLG